jgi:hypothetical protein
MENRNDKSHIIEIFIEHGCSACQKVIDIVESITTLYNLQFAVFERESDSSIFRDRNVIICPATFIDQKLEFYGEFQEEEFRQKILRER